MGRAAAIAYAREGADVAINYFPNEEDACTVIELIRAEGRVAIALPGDLQDEAFCRAGERCRARSGWTGPPREQCRTPAGARFDPRDFQRRLRRDDEDQHLRAVPDHQGRSRASAARSHNHRVDLRAGNGPSPDLYDYAQTKAATTNFVRSLAKQFADRGIRVNGVAPGPIWTPLQVSGDASMEKLEQFGSKTPMGRPGHPAELASIDVQLAAADASYSTGQI